MSDVSANSSGEQMDALRLSRGYEPSETREYREAGLGIHLGSIIYGLRGTAGLSHDELAAKIDLTSSEIEKIEAGVLPDLMTINRIAEVLGISATLTFGNEEESPDRSIFMGAHTED